MSTLKTKEANTYEDSSDDDIPLAKRHAIQNKDSEDETPLSQRVKRVKEESDSEDDQPISSRKTLMKKKPVKKAVKQENGDNDHVSLTKKLKSKTEAMDVDMPSKKRPLESSSSTTIKREKKVKKEEDDPTLYKWWEEENPVELESDDTIKWTKLQHNGVLFPPEYVPHGVKMNYNGKPITLTPEAEEVASFFAALLETDHAQNPVFQKNFFNDWQEILKQDPRNPKITDFKKCDFRPIWEKFEKDKENKKQMTKEEKLRAKEEKAKAEEPYLYALVDGRKEKVGNFRIEPPGLFRGRGSHPKTGKLKKRVMPEQVTLNLGVDAKIPEPPQGHKWAAVVHDQTATWLATWKENVNGSIKYVFLAATSAWKGQSDMQKFEKARELKKHVKRIRDDYTAELKHKLSEIRQRATAMYLIDRLALRAGNEKGEDEADTVGCCSLRYEHITLEPPNTVHFDFLGKDSIRYQNSVQVDSQIYKNINIFKKQVGLPGHMIFDRLSTTGLNKHLNNYMKGLSAKVFRTYNASITFQQQVDLLTNPNDSVADKLLSYNRANREVAILCNHQKTASKTHEQMISKIGDRIRALKYQRMKLRKQLFALDAKLKKKPEYAELESDLDEEWIVEHEKDLVEKEKEKIKNRFEKQNAKLAAENQPMLPAAELQEKLKAADELAKRLKSEHNKQVIEPKSSMTVDKLIAQINKIDERISATKNQATDKEENKEIALGTSKLNYIDPRITIAWCRSNNVPLEKVFSKTLLDKFRWAQNIPDDWKF
ncbi:uncharacterized protein B0P05DRAFT_525680 [Gilbertella persicaria]|uniref:uncharacterized protein n=1 Tax=Gilbertella persicaria TaxID=101096 RepID=UPI00221FE446|nr:uncharacterized protein B0P05DRAFT_525680 [Gilbertella persicaria]KAI8092290.1 hypothetical protein B0P05DRAFT_525680 [Gilbertella persicaria]